MGSHLSEAHLKKPWNYKFHLSFIYFFYFFLFHHKKWTFPLRIDSVNGTNSAGKFTLHIYWRNLWWKTSFFVQCLLQQAFILFTKSFKATKRSMKKGKISNIRFLFHSKESIHNKRHCNFLKIYFFFMNI